MGTHGDDTRPSRAELSFPRGTEPGLRATTGPGAARPVVLVLGGTGYVGGRLIPRLLAGGYRVRVLTRSRERLHAMRWGAEVDVEIGDAADPQALRHAMTGVDLVYYLVHSMAAGRQFAAADRQIAAGVASAAAAAGVRRIVYLGGLHPEGVTLSAHLASRLEVARILLAAPTPTIVLNAGVIIGSGSASFEMVRHLTEVLPYMPAPKWVRNFIQPIAIRDVLYYLLAAGALPQTENRAFDIGGTDVLRYGQMMNGYAVEAGLPQRHIAALPVLTPKLASHWVGLVTPVPRSIARPLVESLQFDCVMHDHDIDGVIPRPDGGLTSYRQSVRLALGRMETDDIETSWIDARVPRAPSDPMPGDPDWAGRTVFTDERRRETSASMADVWAVIAQIGGQTGWYSAPVLWGTRGFVDRVLGGVGMQRGRRSREHLRVGDAVDVWRVEHVETERVLRLRAEMKVPGQAWLELGVEPRPSGSEYWQRAVFFPRGLSGRLYWLAMLPFHGLIFNRMKNRIVAEAERVAVERATDEGAAAGRKA